MNILKPIILAAGIVFCANSHLFAQSNKGKTTSKTTSAEIPWLESRKLTWNDFKGKAGPNETKYALTTSGISVGTSCQGGKFTYQVKAVFVPSESWTKDRTNADLLAHEQAHFDITELHARKLRLAFSLLPDGCVLNSEQISDLVNPIYAESDKMQTDYDKTTRHGLDKAAQEQWEILISESLKALEQAAQ